MRTIILDGYNVMLRSPAFRPDERRDLAAARDKLVNLLSWAVGAQGEVRFLLVFDGADVPGQPRRRTTGVRDAEGAGRVDVRYSTPPQKADDLIRSLVEELVQNERDVTVVTSDAEVLRHAQSQGATLVLADLFAASLFEDKAVSAKAGVKRGAAPRATGSPTAEGSDAEAKPGGMSKKQAAEWLRMFEEREDSEESH
jgi:predicted RNA-binding protein with PIN domain